jgi:hypothetical protein
MRCKNGNPNRSPREKGLWKLVLVNLTSVLAICSALICPSFFPSRSTEEVYTLWNGSACHKFVKPEFVDRVCDGDRNIKSCRHGEMHFTTAGQTERLPLKEV